jgi:hypothetical protein
LNSEMWWVWFAAAAAEMTHLVQFPDCFLRTAQFRKVDKSYAFLAEDVDAFYV